MPLPARLSLALGLWLVFVTPASADSPVGHTVAWGETLYSIARSYGVTPQAIAATNGIGVDSWLHAGQAISIPIKTSGGSVSAPRLSPTGYYTVRAGDTLFSIASRFGSSVASLATINNLPDDGVIYVGWTLKIPTTAPASSAKPIAPRAVSPTYIVQSDDYLYQIAVRYGITVQAIAVANNLPNNWLIYSGQRLLIPNSDSVPNPIPVNTTSQRNSLDVRIANIPLYKQKQTLTCEEASVAMATRGAVSESRLVAAMPRSDNPFEGIRGRTNPSYYGGLTDYGSYAQAVQKGLETLGKQSKVLYGQSYADFRASIIQHLQDGYPVVWWHTWRDTYQKPVMVKTKDGTSVKLVPYEHVGTIVAANDRGITYHDPYDATTRSASWSEFRRVSAYFDNMALVVQ